MFIFSSKNKISNIWSRFSGYILSERVGVSSFKLAKIIMEMKSQINVGKKRK